MATTATGDRQPRPGVAPLARLVRPGGRPRDAGRHRLPAARRRRRDPCRRLAGPPDPYAVLGTAAVYAPCRRHAPPVGASRRRWHLVRARERDCTSRRTRRARPVVAESSIVHLWDEVVSHLVWYSRAVPRHRGARVGAARCRVPRRARRRRWPVACSRSRSSTPTSKARSRCWGACSWPCCWAWACAGTRLPVSRLRARGWRARARPPGRLGRLLVHRRRGALPSSASWAGRAPPCDDPADGRRPERVDPRVSSGWGAGTCSTAAPPGRPMPPRSCTSTASPSRGPTSCRPPGGWSDMASTSCRTFRAYADAAPDPSATLDISAARGGGVGAPRRARPGEGRPRRQLDGLPGQPRGRPRRP